MHIEDIKRWHWIAISIVVGLALSWVWSNFDFQENLPSLGQRDFEAGLMTEYPADRSLMGITVNPPTSEGRYTVIAYQLRDKGVPGEMSKLKMAFVTDAPYKAGLWRGAEEEYPNVLEYLKQVKSSNPKVAFRFAWWRQPWAIYTLWTGASVLLIGGVWPSVVSLMVGAGLGFHKKEEGPEYDLSRFKAEKEKAKAAAGGATAADMEHLHQLEEELEKKLAAQRAGMPIPEDEPDTAAAVKKLDGGPLQTVAADKPAEDHEYKGEFYPVDRGAKKK
jgi:hypothetical protein